jgi:hypothetical protein
MPREKRPRIHASHTPTVDKIVAVILAALTVWLFLTRYLPRHMVWPLLRLLPGAEGFSSTNSEAVPEFTALAAALLMVAEILVLTFAVWTAQETCAALTRVPPHPLHVSYRSLILFAGWCCAAFFHIWLAHSYIGVSALPVDSIGGVILESLMIAGAAVAAYFGWRVDSPHKRTSLEV